MNGETFVGSTYIRFDDVLQATDPDRSFVPADGKYTLKLVNPDTGKRERYDLDVSPEGRKLIEQMEVTARRAHVEADKELRQIVRKAAGGRTKSGPRGSSGGSDNEDSGSGDSAPTT